MKVIFNGNEIDLKDGTMLLDYLNEKNYNIMVIATEINGEIIPKSKYEKIVINDGDKIEIVSFVGGGWFWIYFIMNFNSMSWN